MESKAFSRSTKTIYSPVFHSRICSTMILNVAIWSQHDLSLRNTVCSSSRSLSSRASFILSKMILQRTLLGTVGSIIPLQFSQRHKSPFLGSLTSRPTFQPWGTSSSFQILFKSASRALAETIPPSFQAFGGMLSHPEVFAFFKDFKDLIPLLWWFVLFECLAVALLLDRMNSPGPACSGLPWSVLFIGFAGPLSWSRLPRSCPWQVCSGQSFARWAVLWYRKLSSCLFVLPLPLLLVQFHQSIVSSLSCSFSSPHDSSCCTFLLRPTSAALSWRLPA